MKNGKFNTVITAFVVVSLALAYSCVSGQEEVKVKSEKDIIREITSNQEKEREGAVRFILDRRKELIKSLIPIIDPVNSKNYKDESRAVAAYVLGEIRAVEAVPVLSTALADEPFSDVVFRKGINPYYASVVNALVKIGRPSVPAMIENLKTTDNKKVMSDSVMILSQVLGGKQRVLTLVGKLIKNESDQTAKLRLKKVNSWIEENVKEDQPPQY